MISVIAKKQYPYVETASFLYLKDRGKGYKNSRSGQGAAVKGIWPLSLICTDTLSPAAGAGRTFRGRW